MTPHIKVDARQFQAALRDYMKVSKSELSKVINQKAFSVAIAAVAITKRGSKSRIRKQLMSDGRNGAPMGAAIVNYTLKRGGRRAQGIAKAVGVPVGKGLWGQKMREAEKAFVERQQNAINFLRGGWLSAVAVIGQKIQVRGGVKENAREFVRRYGFKGGATLAKPGLNPTATLWNSALSYRTSTQNGIKYATEGLQKAINQEAGRMRAEIERRLQAGWNQVAGRFLR